MSLWNDENVRAWLRQAWQDSRPGTNDAREQGGFVLQDADGFLSVERWPRGEQDRIVVPPHMGGRRTGKRIVATFHTHPNAGDEYEQEPSLTDIRAVRDDPDLQHAEYEGELVIATENLYRIRPDGSVEIAERTDDFLLGGV